MSRPTILSQSHIQRALADLKFYEALPEFGSLRVKMQTMKADLTSGRGCSSCKQRRVVATLFNDFMSVASSLSDDGKERLRKYLGAESVMINRFDPVTRQVKLETI